MNYALQSRGTRHENISRVRCQTCGQVNKKYVLVERDSYLRISSRQLLNMWSGKENNILL